MCRYFGIEPKKGAAPILTQPLKLSFSGKTGIRTLGTRKGTTVFETAPIDHSGIFPWSCALFCECKFTKTFFPVQVFVKFFEIYHGIRQAIEKNYYLCGI